MSKQKLSDLARKRGIYAGVLMGAIIIVATVMILVTQNAGSDIKKEERIDLNDSALHQGTQDPVNDPDIANNNTENKVADINQGNITDVPEVVTPVPKAEVTEQPDSNEKTVSETKEPEQTAQVMINSAKNLSFNKEDGLSWPVEGEILLPYSIDRTQYFQTLKEFKINPAVLIQADQGTEVKAAAKGIVTAIENDPRTGYTVTMDIGSDYKVVYGQLEKPNLKIGALVEQGDKVGNLAAATKYFVVEGPHLYFQVYEGEKTLDPVSLFKTE